MLNQNFNFKNLDKRLKATLVSKNMTETRIGSFKGIRTYEHSTYNYTNLNFGEANSICDVQIVHEHSLDVAGKYADVGFPQNFTFNNNKNPVVVNIVSNEFMGSGYEQCEEMRDDMMNVRTNLCTCNSKNNVWPIKENSCVHTPLVLVIRSMDSKMGFLPKEKSYRTGIITISPICQPSDIKKFNSCDLAKTLILIESIFQCAIAMKHKVLILPPLGLKHKALNLPFEDEDNNPIEDIIKIYNYCILEYGHLFEHIIIAVPQYYPKDIYEIYNAGVFKPSEFVAEIDDKYEEIKKQNKIKLQLEEQIKQNQKQKKIKN